MYNLHNNDLLFFKKIELKMKMSNLE